MKSHTPLGDHIRAHVEHHDRGSRNAFASRALDPETGNRILVQWVIHLINGQIAKAPEPWRLRALAAAMSSKRDTGPDMESYRRDLRVIRRLAAAQWFEMTELLEAENGSTATFSVPPSLSDEKRRLVIQWAEMIARDLA